MKIGNPKSLSFRDPSCRTVAFKLAREKGINRASMTIAYDTCLVIHKVK